MNGKSAGSMNYPPLASSRAADPSYLLASPRLVAFLPPAKEGKSNTAMASGPRDSLS